MKRCFLALALMCIIAPSAPGGVILSTSNPPGAPLDMAAGSVSAPMDLIAASSTGTDTMAGWNVSLLIVPQASALGTLTFHDPGTFQNPANPAPNPPDYIFTSGTGILTTNSGSALMAGDTDQSGGTLVPLAPGANLLQLDFAATSNASGLFGIFADPANSQWTSPDGSGGFNSNSFDIPSEVPGLRHIGDVYVVAVPEPSALTLLLVGIGILGVSYGWRSLASLAAIVVTARLGRGP